MDKLIKWTDKEIKILTKNYPILGLERIIKLLPARSKIAIQHKATNLKLKSPNAAHLQKYSFNELFFNIPDINNCYWAGLIAADGCIRKHLETTAFFLQHKESDIELLEQFKKSIKYSGNLHKTFSIKNNKKFYAYRIVIYKIHQWFKDLYKNFNITPKKSLTLKPPNITNLEQQLAFIIGYIDGDGCIYKTNNILGLNICGTKQLLEWISEIFYKIEDITKYNKLNVYKKSNSKIYYIVTTNKRAKNILTILKKHKTPYKLSRKWNII